MKTERIDQGNRAAVDAFILRQWYTMEMAVHGESVDLSHAEGWTAMENGEIIGLITYRLAGNALEILSLDSLKEHRGIGTALLNEAVREARRTGCARVWLITTNDNLSALCFYQKRGFDMEEFCRNAVDEARKIKPQIPLIGLDGIPIRHEIVLEMRL